SYDAAGNLLTAADDRSSYAFSYDALNRVVTVDAPFGSHLTFGYDAVGNRISVQDAWGGLTTSTYDGDNELTSRTFGTGNGGPRVDFSYNALHQLTGIDRSSVTTALAYDALNRVTSIVDSNSGGTIGTLGYTYDAASRL